MNVPKSTERCQQKRKFNISAISAQPAGINSAAVFRAPDSLFESGEVDTHPVGRAGCDLSLAA
jgi:hypothetical protein